MGPLKWATHAAVVTAVLAAAIIGVAATAEASQVQQGGCSTPDPFVTIGGGTCINGGWVPTASVTPPPTSPPPPVLPPGGCSTPDPFVTIGGGTCINGGWVPGVGGAPPGGSPPPPPVNAGALFTALSDARPGKFFDAAASVVAPGEPNRLLIGFNSGVDPVTLSANDFRAAAGAFGNTSAMDTISFTVNAPSGFYISRITYSQQGGGSVLRNSIEAGSATWVVDGRAATLGVFTSDPTVAGSADLTGLNRTSVPVSITLALFASTGAVVVNTADVLVELQPLIR